MRLLVISGIVRRFLMVLSRHWPSQTLPVRTATQFALMLAFATPTYLVSRLATHQDREPVPASGLERYQIAAGKEVIIAFVGSSDCGFSRDVLAREAFRKVIKSVRDQAPLHGIKTVSVVGVAVDWLPDRGLQFLRSVADFDELIVGRSWLSTGVDRYLRSTGGKLEVPQVIVLERAIAVSANDMATSSEDVVITKRGLREIETWAQAGAPLETR